jgi:hypothetical protein
MPVSHRILEVRAPVRVVRPEVGPPICYVILDDIEQTVQIGRHYRDGRTIPCDCSEPCDSYRLDYFMRALRLASVDAGRCHHWEPVVLHLTDQAVRSIETLSQTAGLIGGLAGTKCRLNRVGNTLNGRIQVKEVDRAVIKSDPGFSVATVLTLRRVPGFYPLYERHNTDQVDVPARTRSDRPLLDHFGERISKPRVPKGRPLKK